jgi:malonate transporter and related proteins
MQAVINAALPIFALILTGYLCGRLNVLGDRGIDSLNRFAVYLALPALLFRAMTRITFEQFSQLGFALSFAAGIIVPFSIAFLLSRRRKHRVSQASIEALDASYANVGFMGIPLCLLVFGESSIPASVIATLFTACLLFAVAIMVIESDLQQASNISLRIRNLGLSLARNPLLVAPAAGLAIGMAGLSLPGAFDQFVAVLGGAASPVALVCVGLFLAQERTVGSPKAVAILVALKLLVQPGVTGLLAFYVFKMPPVWSHSAVLLSALPIGSGPFVLATLYGLEGRVTSGAILVSHLCSVVTVSLLVAWLG